MALPAPVYHLYENPLVLEVPEVLEKIAKCESGGKQFKKNRQGVLEIIRGQVNPKDVGFAQINEDYWLEKSLELGPDYNIYTYTGNRNMMVWIYGEYGTKPWKWSKPCHGV